MRTYRVKLCRWMTIGYIGMLASVICYGHDWPVHTNITAVAFASSDGLNTFLTENLESLKLTASPPQAAGTLSPSGWLQLGSKMEDELKYAHNEERTMDHFYTVISQRTAGQVIGLTDGSEHPWWDIPGWLPGDVWFTGGIVNSFIWATEDGISGPLDVGPNDYKWYNARNLEYVALASGSQTTREEFMAEMLYALGHILHLNQDLTSPDHVRDDNHYSKAYFEDYGLKNYANNPQWFAPQPHGWAYWQSQGFSKLLDFWDRGKFINGSSDALNQEAAGTLKLGLAEFSNGNFLGEDALYAEYFDSSDIHYFPFPSLWTSTTFSDLKNSLAPYADVSFLKNGRPINRFYIEKRKDADGIFVKHHSALLYLGIQGAGQNTGKDQLKVSSTIHDPTVLQDYHSILIPKAVEYSTGILDYFFRGKFVTSDPTPYGSSQFQVQVSNESGQDLKGGTFHLFWDDSTGNRSELTGSDFSTTYSGALAAGGTITVTFTPPVNAVRYTLVYQGTIGTSGGTALDPVDDGIAVIAARLHSCNNVQDLDWTIDEQQDLGTSVNVDMSGGDGSFDLTGSWGNDPCNGVPNAWADISADVCNVTDPAYDITVTVDYSGTPEQTVSCNDPYTGPWTLVDGLYLTIYVDGDLVANAGLIGDGYPLTGQLSTVVHLDVGSSHHIAIGPEAEGLGRLTGTITIRPLVHP